MVASALLCSSCLRESEKPLTTEQAKPALEEIAMDAAAT